MLQQHAETCLQGCSPQEFDAAAEAFETLPLWFLTFYGRYVLVTVQVQLQEMVTVQVQLQEMVTVQVQLQEMVTMQVQLQEIHSFKLFFMSHSFRRASSVYSCLKALLMCQALLACSICYMHLIFASLI
jgi:hypothetical protein